MRRNSYPTDLKDAQWQRIARWVPEPKPGGRPAKYSRREIVNAILYLTRNGCAWRSLPHDFPPYRIVFHYFGLWQKDGTWETIHARLRERVRRETGRTSKPSAAVLDSQSVKTTEQQGGALRGVTRTGMRWIQAVPRATVQRNKKGPGANVQSLRRIAKRQSAGSSSRECS